ncbi:MAG: 4Fe-4S binding protein [Promethearchaeia archaeon]
MNEKKWEDNDHWVIVDLEECVASGECVEICPVECYEIIEGKVDVENIGECIECMACQGICPTEAILDQSSWE